jgi:hypothetical protein
LHGLDFLRVDHESDFLHVVVQRLPQAMSAAAEVDEVIGVKKRLHEFRRGSFVCDAQDFPETRHSITQRESSTGNGKHPLAATGGFM